MTPRITLDAVRTAPLCRTVPLEGVASLLDWQPDAAGVVWLRHGDGFVAWGEALRVEVGTGPDRFADAAATLAGFWDRLAVTDEVGVPGTGPVAFGCFTFDPLIGESAQQRPWMPSRGSVLVVPEVIVGRRGNRAWLTVIGDAPTPQGPASETPAAHGRVRYQGSSLSEIDWLTAVDRAVEEIRAGALAKIVLARDRRVWSRDRFDARLLADRLMRRFPSCWTFSVDGLVGATPELLARREGGTVASTVLAGSAPRGETAEDDARIGAGMVASAKDREEHELAVASVREILGPLTRDLRADAEPYLLRLDNVQHLATDLRGRTRAELSALELAGRLHPTAAVCGTPATKAMDRIRQLEAMDRARYSGPVGWVDARGEGEWAIALRCAELDGARARLFAGAGIVGDSLPEAELEETRLKLRAMQSAFEG